MTDKRLRLTEIFYSLQGEAQSQGKPTVFVRLTGCPLRCGYCDTSYAFQGGEDVEIAEILEKVGSFEVPYVTVTGGEPLAQKNCHMLLKDLCDKDYKVSLETSGALDVSPVDSRVVIVMDIKTPDSGEADKNRYDNIQLLKKQDMIKFVICSRSDYDWAKEIMEKYQLPKQCEVLFTPGFQQQNVTELAEWVLQDRLPVRMQIQLHKLLWGDVAGK